VGPNFGEMEMSRPERDQTYRRQPNKVRLTDNFI
jgi:hypothetical protein